MVKYFYMLLKFLVKCQKMMYSHYIRHEFSACPSTSWFERFGLLVGAKYISIGENCSIQKGTYLTAWDSYANQKFNPYIQFGDNCAIGAYNHITCINHIKIGNGLLTGKWVTITDNQHGGADYKSLNMMPSKRLLKSKGGVVIGDNVWLGDKVTVLPGVTIGEGTVVAANSVVTHDVPPFCVVAGCPAKVVRKLNR